MGKNNCSINEKNSNLVIFIMRDTISDQIYDYLFIYDNSISGDE